MSTTDIRQGIIHVPNPVACRDERRVHVDVVRDVDEIREVAVLAEELGEGDRLSGRAGIRLVGRTQDDDDVTAPVRVQRVRAVDVPQLPQLLSFITFDVTFAPG